MVELKSPKGRTKRRTLTAKATAAAATAKKRKKRKMLKKNKPRTRNKRVMVKPPSTLQMEAKLQKKAELQGSDPLTDSYYT